MRNLLPARLVRRALASHAWLGILVAAPMYLVCLSGTLAVFAPELGRWEQPATAARSEIPPAALEAGYRAALARERGHSHHVFLSLPTADLPRARVATDDRRWYVAPDGTLGPPVTQRWTDMLVGLHLTLHLPESFGMVVVSLLGALLCGLIVSGFLAHPRLLKDAFRWRRGGVLEQVDVHNRLSVWGAPFHLMIAITGAYFGLAMLFTMLAAALWHDGDSTPVMAAVFGPEPVLSGSPDPMPVARILERMGTLAPGATPIYVTIEDSGTPAQYAIVGATHPGRLIYAEQYRFDGDGRFLDAVGFADGPAGRQAAFSVYRLHFGHFGGFGIKLLYGVFGIALTVVSVTGVSVWLARRPETAFAARIWAALVWGTVPALAASAIFSIASPLPAAATFWLFLVVALALARHRDHPALGKARLQLASALALSGLIATHALVFGLTGLDPAAPAINGLLAVCAAAYAVAGHRALRAAADVPAPARASKVQEQAE